MHLTAELWDNGKLVIKRTTQVREENKLTTVDETFLVEEGKAESGACLLTVNIHSKCSETDNLKSLLKTANAQIEKVLFKGEENDKANK